MAKAITRLDEATEIANDIAGTNTEIEFWGENESGSLSFKYEGGCIHANRLPDEWRICGFGSGWFTIDD